MALLQAFLPHPEWAASVTSWALSVALIRPCATNLCEVVLTHETNWPWFFHL